MIVGGRRRMVRRRGREMQINPQKRQGGSDVRRVEAGVEAGFNNGCCTDHLD